ncbi:MAG: GNAT family N-acetyltransferase [Candidatus Hodarchaeota archaeon]
MDVTIRSLMKSDFQPIKKFHKQIIGDFDNQTQEENFYRYIQLNSKLIKIAIKGSKIIGYILGYRINPRKVRIYSIFVLPQFQRKQIGFKLIKSFENDIEIMLPDLRYLSIRIPQKFFNSTPFFKNLGFNLITKLNNYQKRDLSFPYQLNLNVFIRSLKKKEEDLTNLIRLERKCFPDYWQMEKSEFIKALNSETTSIFLAFKDEHLVGYNYNTISETKPEGHYVRIATHPNFRQQYIATSLTAMAFHWFKKHQVKRILLSTYADSPVHNRLYQNWGFKTVDQEIIMAKHYF